MSVEGLLYLYLYLYLYLSLVRPAFEYFFGAARYKLSFQLQFSCYVPMRSIGFALPLSGTRRRMQIEKKNLSRQIGHHTQRAAP